MAATQEKTSNAATASTEPDPRPGKIDRTAPAGSENSLGAESIRDGRPNTDDRTIEAIDEQDPGATEPLPADKTSTNR
jgi:hypothetical protein